jgi:hypothetical protein
MDINREENTLKQKLGAGSGFARQAAPIFIMHAFKLPASFCRRCQAETSSEQRLLIEVPVSDAESRSKVFRH